MAVASWNPVLGLKLPETLEEIPDGEEGFKITLEDELIHIYDFQTLFKANEVNLKLHGDTYNMACKAAERRGDRERVAELIDIRFNARRQGMEGEPIELLVSPYTDEGAAICYGYVEGALQMVKETESTQEMFNREFSIIRNADGSSHIVKRG